MTDHTARDRREPERTTCVVCFGLYSKKGGRDSKHPLVCRECGKLSNERGEDLQGSGWEEDWGTVP